MVVGNMPEAADLLIVGGGPGGYTAAAAAARAGRKVMLYDRDGEAGLGGVCLQVGCIPSKALIELSEHAARLHELPEMGLPVTPVAADLAVFQAWKTGLVERLTGGVRSMLKAAGVDVRRGQLRLTGPRSAVASDGEGSAQFVDFKDLIIATGSRPATLAVLPVDGNRVLDSTGALALTTLPHSVAVVGAGYIGLEIGTALAKLGVAVTLVEAAERMLPAMPAELLGPIARRLEALGVAVLVATQALSLERDGLAVQHGTQRSMVPAEQVIVAVGRVPNTDDLGLEEARLQHDANGLLAVAPDRLLTPHIAAIGDITAGPALAHKATAEAAVAVAALGGARVAFEPAAIPAVVFSDPEVGSVGLGAAQAAELGIETRRARLPLGASGRAATMGRSLGFVELVVDAADATVLGAHFVGPHASELVAEAALAIEMGVTAEDLALTVHPHPTLSEQLAEVAQHLLRQTAAP